MNSFAAAVGLLSLMLAGQSARHGTVDGEPAQFGPSQEFRGLWRNAFEGSRFCPAPATSCDQRTPGDRIWLDGGPIERPDGKLYHVQFVGRQTVTKGQYGHMGVSDHAIMVEQVTIYGEHFERQ